MSDSSCDDNDLSTNMSPPTKKVKRLVKFNTAWLKNYAWIMSAQNEYQAHCKLCRCNFSILH